MRRGSLALALILVATLAIGVAPASASRASGIKGKVVNTTCPGPCAEPPPPPPLYTGDGLSVTVTRVSTNRVVATLHPSDGRFRVRLRRGRYRVTSDVDGWCWQGETKSVRVRRHRFTAVTLAVANICIV